MRISANISFDGRAREAFAFYRELLGGELVMMRFADLARSFYERHGFRLVSLRDGSANEERELDAVYAWHPGPVDTA